MANELSSMTLKPIGIVSNGIKQRLSYDDWRKITSDIVIDNNLTEALDNLDEFSHIIVIYWMHQLTEGQVPLKVHPKGRRELPEVGLFASRSPNRPNPIGETTVRLLERRGNRLKVKGLDAIDGTPVIDIKPYIPGYDSTTNVKVPRWIKSQ